MPLEKDAKAKGTVACQGSGAPCKGATSDRLPRIDGPRSREVWHPQECDGQCFPPHLCQVMEDFGCIILSLPKCMKNDRTHAVRSDTACLKQVPTG